MPRLSPSLALLLSLALVAGFSLWLVLAYGLEGYATQLVPGFAAALLAFVIALAQERDREARRAVADAEQLVEERQTEVRRRLATVRDELIENRETLDLIWRVLTTDPERPREPGERPRLAKGQSWLNVSLRAGAWTSATGRGAGRAGRR